MVSEANPLAVIAQFELGPQAALAKVSTRIRLADSQRVYAVAEMNDGALWTGYGLHMKNRIIRMIDNFRFPAKERQQLGALFSAHT